MERVRRIIEILDFAIEAENMPFVTKLITTHNPIDILIKDVDEDIIKTIGKWEQSKMLDTIFMLLKTQSLLDTIMKDMEAIKEHYNGSTIIANTSYPKNVLYDNIDTTLTILFTIVTYYRNKEEKDNV